jgi:hypothetical protein
MGAETIDHSWPMVYGLRSLLGYGPVDGGQRPWTIAGLWAMVWWEAGALRLALTAQRGWNAGAQERSRRMRAGYDRREDDPAQPPPDKAERSFRSESRDYIVMTNS